MSQNESRGLAIGAIAISVLSLAASVAALACSPENEPRSEPVSRVITGSAAPATAATQAPSLPTPARAAPEPVKAAPAPAKEEAVMSAVAPRNAETDKPVAGAAELVVKRFVVASAIEGREPLASGEPFVAGSKPVYAFAELQNPAGAEQEVSVIFERKGSNQRVGYATLKVPASVPRHRTWANTRYIREPGAWDAVLTTAGGVELARTSFEVAPE